MTNYKRYIDFLDDPLFIRWQVMPDKELNAHWKKFAEDNPHLSGELERAIRYLKTTGLNSCPFSVSDKERLINRIRNTFGERERKKRARGIFGYLAVASVVLLIVIGGITLHIFHGNSRDNMSNKIVGNMQSSENIQLITGNKTTSFSEDITLSITEDGETRVRREGQTEEEHFKSDQNETNTLIVPYGKRSKITLSDGSIVWINSGSELRFPAAFTGKTRDIFINGEIYIEVAKSTEKPFYVHTTDFSVNVYGTSFNVSAYPHAPAEVVLVEGSVALETTGSQETRKGTKLNPGELATFNKKGAFEKRKVDASQYTSWKDGYLLFAETTIEEALIQIGRLYNLTFDMGNNLDLKNKHCTGKLLLSENMDDVLNTIAALSGVAYERNKGVIIIKNR